MKRICRIATALIIVLSLFNFIRVDSIDIEYVQANVSVTVDGPVSSGSYTGNPTLSHTTGTGEDRLLLVGVSWGRTTSGTIPRTITSIKFNSIDLELLVDNTQDPMNCVAIYRYPDEAPSEVLSQVTITFSTTVNTVTSNPWLIFYD